MSAAEDGASLAATLEEQLSELESDVSELESAEWADVDDPDGRIPEGEAASDEESAPPDESLFGLSDRLDSVRTAMGNIEEEGEEQFLRTRNTFGEMLGQLTQDVRRQWYQVRWDLETV